MSKSLKEEDAGLGFLCPEGSSVIGVPVCNVCLNWDGPGRCKIRGKSPLEYRECIQRDCPDAVLDTELFTYPRYAELYPEDAERQTKKP